MTDQHELIRTIISSIGAVTFGLGIIFTLKQFVDQYKLRRFQALLSLNERLDRFCEAYNWINNPVLSWNELPDTTKYQYEGYISAFEDIGIARKLGVISREDFLSSYGGRYNKLMSSGTFPRYMNGSGYKIENFSNLEILNGDIESHHLRSPLELQGNQPELLGRKA